LWCGRHRGADGLGCWSGSAAGGYGGVSLFLLSLLSSLSFLLRAAAGGLSLNGFPTRTAFLPIFYFFSSVSGLGGGARGAILGLGCDAP
jgi:hypothetical protein